MSVVHTMYILPNILDEECHHYPVAECQICHEKVPVLAYVVFFIVLRYSTISELLPVLYWRLSQRGHVTCRNRSLVQGRPTTYKNPYTYRDRHKMSSVFYLEGGWWWCYFRTAIPSRREDNNYSRCWLGAGLGQHLAGTGLISRFS